LLSPAVVLFRSALFDSRPLGLADADLGFVLGLASSSAAWTLATAFAPRSAPITALSR
jgi:hypothetical protein